MKNNEELINNENILNDSQPKLVYEWCQLLDSHKIVVPRIQRKSSWDIDKRVDLLNTIVGGYPFGMLTITSNIGKTGKEQYFLVDGLQRSMAIWTIARNFLSLATSSVKSFRDFSSFLNLKKSISELPDDLVTNFIINELSIDGVLLEEYKEDEKQDPLYDLVSIVHEIFKSERRVSFVKPNGYQIFDGDLTADHFDQLFLLFKKSSKAKNKKFLGWKEQSLANIFYIFRNLILDKLRITRIYFQIFNIEASNENDRIERMSEAFFRLNVGGKPLTKFEIYTSLWNKYQVQILDPKNIVLKNMRNLYEDKTDDRIEMLGEIESEGDHMSPSEIIISMLSICIDKLTAIRPDNLFKINFKYENKIEVKYRITKVDAFFPLLCYAFLDINDFNESTRDNPIDIDEEQVGKLIFDLFNVDDVKEQNGLFDSIINSIFKSMTLVNDALFDLLSISVDDQGRPKRFRTTKDSAFIMSVLTSVYLTSIDEEYDFIKNNDENYKEIIMDLLPLFAMENRVQKFFKTGSSAVAKKFIREKKYISYIKNYTDLNVFQLQKSIFPYELLDAYKWTNDDDERDLFDEFHRMILVYIARKMNDIYENITENKLRFSSVLPSKIGSCDIEVDESVSNITIISKESSRSSSKILNENFESAELFATLLEKQSLSNDAKAIFKEKIRILKSYERSADIEYIDHLRKNLVYFDEIINSYKANMRSIKYWNEDDDIDCEDIGDYELSNIKEFYDSRSKILQLIFFLL